MAYHKNLMKDAEIRRRIKEILKEKSLMGMGYENPLVARDRLERRRYIKKGGCCMCGSQCGGQMVGGQVVGGQMVGGRYDINDYIGGLLTEKQRSRSAKKGAKKNPWIQFYKEWAKKYGGGRDSMERARVAYYEMLGKGLY